jgi:hypothetical protein
LLRAVGIPPICDSRLTLYYKKASLDLHSVLDPSSCTAQSFKAIKLHNDKQNIYIPQSTEQTIKMERLLQDGRPCHTVKIRKDKVEDEHKLKGACQAMFPPADNGNISVEFCFDIADDPDNIEIYYLSYTIVSLEEELKKKGDDSGLRKEENTGTNVAKMPTVLWG